jgi:hypothetical protein
VVYDTETKQPLKWGKITNDQMLIRIDHSPTDKMVVEMIASYGMPVGQEVFDTCVWIGRFIEACPGPHQLISRKDVKLHLCGTHRAKDTNVYHALLDLYGGGRAVAVGTKKAPGPLYGFKADCWSALAVAITAAENGG